jgi:hypothetical protein
MFAAARLARDCLSSTQQSMRLTFAVRFLSCALRLWRDFLRQSRANRLSHGFREGQCTHIGRPRRCVDDGDFGSNSPGHDLVQVARRIVRPVDDVEKRFVEAGVDDERLAVDEQRIAVRRSARADAGAYVAASAGMVFDIELLAEILG